MDKNIKNKSGSIEILFICVILVFFMTVFAYVFFLNSKINVTVYRVKQDLYNIVQNVILSFNKQELSYNNYVINEEEMSSRVAKIIDLNYKEASLKYLNYNKEENEVNIIVSISIGNKIVDVKQNVKLKLMQINSY